MIGWTFKVINDMVAQVCGNRNQMSHEKKMAKTLLRAFVFMHDPRNKSLRNSGNSPPNGDLPPSKGKGLRPKRAWFYRKISKRNDPEETDEVCLGWVAYLFKLCFS